MALYLGKDLVSASSGLGGATIKNQDKTFTENGSYSADSGYTGLGIVKVDVQPNNQDKNITANGTYRADSGYTGLGEVVVAVPPTPPNNQDITVNENGTYTAEDGYSGLGTVTVEVPTGGGGDDFAGMIDETLTEVEIPEGISLIRPYAFYYHKNIKKLWIGNNIKSIGNSAFAYCYGLEEVYINASGFGSGNNPSIFTYAGQEGNGIKLTIGKNVLDIPSYTFKAGNTNQCARFTSLEFEEGSVCTTIGESTFLYNAYIKTITIPDTITKIGKEAFRECQGIEEIHFNASSMMDGATNARLFDNAGINGTGINVFIGKNVSRIPAWLFRPMTGASNLPNIISLEFEEGSVCTTIGAYAFGTSATEPIWDFTKCTTVPTLANSNAFSGFPSTGVIRVPAFLYDEWIAATNWSTYASQIVAV
jgi:hypothetical protein